MLFQTAPNLALSYLSRIDREVSKMHHSFQLSIIWMIRRRCKIQTGEKVFIFLLTDCIIIIVVSMVTYSAAYA
jgi:cell division protein FtsL